VEKENEEANEVVTGEIRKTRAPLQLDRRSGIDGEKLTTHGIER